MLQPNKRRAMIRFDRKRHTSAIAALLPLPLLFSVPAIAQQLDAAAAAEAPAPSSAAKPAADSDDSKIAEIVVTAQRREEKLQEVPIAVTAMDDKQIETRGIQNVGDLSAQAQLGRAHV